MNRLHLRFAPGAAEQLNVAAEWWKQNRPAAADLFTAEFRAAAELLCEVPAVGAIYPNDELRDVRRYLMRKTRFHIYYVVDANALIIAAVWSAVRGHGPFAPSASG
ncbi:MAG: type II toxin-antitoxin system RelE/ParE family toxin [Deltaproteobacteria bacterium]|nr:type II toxin-antitoxin system RelE/ParE family toxin [Deltaproteobacteria bacterium]